MPSGNAATLSLGSASCSLSAVSFLRSERLVANGIDARLDFTGCTSGPGDASVLVGIEKAADSFMSQASFFPWLQQSCSETTTTKKVMEVQTSLQVSQNLLGTGNCEGKIMKEIEAASADVCKMLCFAKVTEYNGNTNPESCTGYAFNVAVSAGKRCVLYKGSTLGLGQADAAWECFNVEGRQVAVQMSTAAPPTADELAAAEAKLPKLNINQQVAAAGSASASVLQFTSPADQCFKPFNIITLEDATFRPLNIRLKAAEFYQLENMLPALGSAGRLLSSMETTPGLAAVQVDRVSYAPSAAAAAPSAMQKNAAVPAAAPTASPVVQPAVPCTPVPPVHAFSFLSMLMNVILFFSIFGAGYGGWIGGQRYGERAVKQGSPQGPAE